MKRCNTREVLSWENEWNNILEGYELKKEKDIVMLNIVI